MARPTCSGCALLISACFLLAVLAAHSARLPESSKRIDPTASASDQVTSLPGYSGKLTSNHYAGYVTVDEKHQKKLFYYFVESERDPSTDPVVVWLNGGPGCSSFDGFIFEQGPFLYKLVPDGAGNSVELTDNPYAWSKTANMLFIDSPAGVGMSYSEVSSDYETDDTRTAADANTFLRRWFTKYPAFLKNDFYISGESYAGIYVPNLSRAVVEGNYGGEVPKINIKGYLVGNGCTDNQYDGNAHPLFASGKSLISHHQFVEAEAACGGNYWNRTQDGDCDTWYLDMLEQLAALNVYDVLEDCFHDGPAAAAANSQAPRLEQVKALRAQGLLGKWPLLGAVQPGPVLNWAHLNQRLNSMNSKRLGLTPPCTDSRCLADSPMLGHSPPCTNARVADLWLNDPEVRSAIHAAPASQIGPWTLCSDKISYFHDAGSMIPIHKSLTRHYGLRALIYSGDHDMAVPHTGSEAWTRGLNYEVKSEWRPWYVADSQVAGYTVEYGHQLTYATVKGAGHMVPETNPREALALFQRFLEGNKL